jgi:hypothetical protein
VSVALVTKYAKIMRSTILLSVACQALPYFHALSHKQHDFREILNIKSSFRFSLQILPEAFLILRRIRRDIIIDVHACTRGVTVTIFRF